jgi:TolA-binding protein
MRAAMNRLSPLILLVALAGCFYPADRGRLVEVRLDKLADSNQRLEKQLKDSDAKQAETLAQVQKALESLDKAAHRSDADIGVQLQKTVEDVASLRGQVETYQYKVTELENALKAANEELAKKATDADAAKQAEAKKKADEMKRPDEPKDFLRLADDKQKGGDLALARQLYNEFLKKWPRDDSVGEVHFSLGETYLQEDRCREALYEYGKVIQDFAKAKVAPNAYLRSSECFRKLKMMSEAKLALDELLKQHPKSDAAKTAKTRLAELAKDAAKDPKKPEAAKKPDPKDSKKAPK